MDYKIITKVLKKDYGWDGFDTLHDVQKELINDVVSATEKETIKNVIAMIDKKGGVYNGADWIISVLKNHLN